MTVISPILKNRLEANNNHENIYRNLTRHANDVKPNLPKAKLIRENSLQGAVSAIKDTFKDGKNFFKATSTGKLNDNNLGRINDLGMKAGALLIATYLASRAKTKTDAIMQFIGGTTFFASMALWPKLFINLPARIAHGFRVDHKYLSAQGDKKDLGLDNQFQPMDIFTDEEMLKMAKNAGIDPNDEFAKEKMQRKLQKTMLQNRTLWMATAGFATPLMTSLIGNFAEPRVRKAVIRYDVSKVKNIVNEEGGLSDYLMNSKPIVTNTKEIEGLFKGKETLALDDSFYKELSDLLGVDSVLEKFKDSDDTKPMELLKSENLIPALKKIREEKALVDTQELQEAVSKMKVLNVANFVVSDSNTSSQALSKEALNRIFAKYPEKISLKEARELLEAETNFSANQIEQTIKGLNADNTPFFTIIKNYNENSLPVIRGRLKSYMDLLNPLIGSKAESAYTAEFNATMQGLLDKLNISGKEFEKMQKATLQEQQEFLSSKMKEFVANNPNYIEILSGKTMEAVDEILGDESLSSKPETILKQIDEITASKDKTIGNLKTSLTKLFGEDFYLVKNDGEFENFVTYIEKNNTEWKNQIVDNYVKSASGSNKKEKYEEFSKIINEFVDSYNSQTAKFKELLAKYAGSNCPALENNASLKKYFLWFKQEEGAKIAGNYINSQAYQDVLKSKAYGQRAQIEEVVDALKSKDNIDKIAEVKDDVEPLTKAVLGGKDGHQGIANFISNFIINKRTDLTSTKLKPIIAANFEARLAKGEFANLTEQEIKFLKNIVYDGTISSRFNRGEIRNMGEYKELIGKLFNPEAFNEEAKIVPDIKTAVSKLKDVANLDGEKYNTSKYFIAGSFSDLMKNFATRLSENRAWKKIFMPMSIALVAITLLVQPLFGKIDKEFPQKTKKEGVNNGN